jgi:DNA-binding NarL/FixJ family response regulator
MFSNDMTADRSQIPGGSTRVAIFAQTGRPMQPLQILIADSRDDVRGWVRRAVEQQAGWTVCGEAKTGPETVAKAIELRPDVVLLDERLPGLSGAEMAREILRVAPTALLLTLTAFTSEHARLHDAVSDQIGASSMEMGQTLVDAIKTFVDEATIDGDRAPARDDRVARGGQSSRSTVERSAALSSREREVLRYVADGKSNKEIGVILSISTRTVETHRARLMRKLGLHSMNQLVRYAIRHRIINA